jgi:hypothetical protein
MLPSVISRKMNAVVAFALVLGPVTATIPRDVTASSSSTIYSFGTTQPIDGGVPKGSLTYVNGFLFGRTTTTFTAPTPGGTPIGSYGVIFHFDPNNVDRVIQSITFSPVATLMTVTIHATTQ